MIELNFRHCNVGVQKAMTPPETPDGEPQLLRILQVQDTDSNILVQIPLPSAAWEALKEAMEDGPAIVPADLNDLRHLEKLRESAGN